MDKLKSGAAALGLDLTPEQLTAFEIYFQELTDWNRKVNLTAITSHEEVQVKHFLDSLTAVSVVSFNDNSCVIDVGTGAGLPGIPLKIVFPQIHLVLLEATAKKTKFLEHITDKLGLKDVKIITGRAEEVAHSPEYRESFNVVISRAVSVLPVLAELALPFCALGGIFIAYKKGDIREELEQARKAVGMMGGVLKEIVPVNPEIFDDNRYLVVIEKTQPTPAEYPRRPGMPEKRPLLA